MKKHFNYKFHWVFVIFCILLSTISLKAQLNCNFPCDDVNWQIDTANIAIGSYNWPNQTAGLHGIAYYKKRKCNDKWEFMLDSAKMVDNSNLLDSLLIYENNYSTFRDLIDLAIMEHYIGISNLLDCPDTNSITKIYSASCGVWVKCRYEISPNSRHCDDGFSPPYPNYIIDTTNFVNIRKWEPCGEVCCQKIYKVCKEISTVKQEMVVKIQNLSKQRHPNTPNCTLHGLFRDGVTNQIIPCKDGC